MTTSPVTGWLRRLGILLALATVAWLGASLLVAHQLTHRLRPAAPERPRQIAGRAPELLSLTASDGLELGAWYFAGSSTAAPSVVLLHGNGASRSHMRHHASIWLGLGASVLLPTLRAHGDSGGDVNDFGLSARRDAHAAIAAVRQRRTRPVIVHGVSLGSAAALFALADNADGVQGVVVESPFESLDVAVSNRTQHYAGAALGSFIHAGLMLAGRIYLDPDTVRPVRAAAQVPPRIRALVISGSDDRLAKPEEARAIYAELRGPKDQVFIAGAGHNNVPWSDPVRYRAALARLAENVVNSN